MRICLTNDETCTGVNPCGECARRIFQEVLPKAMNKSGLFTRDNNAKVQEFFKAYAESWIELVQDLAKVEVAKAPHERPLGPPAQGAALPPSQAAPVLPQKEANALGFAGAPPQLHEPEVPVVPQLNGAANGTVPTVGGETVLMTDSNVARGAPVPVAPPPLPLPDNLPPLDAEMISLMAESLPPGEEPPPPSLATADTSVPPPAESETTSLATNKARALARKARDLRNRLRATQETSGQAPGETKEEAHG